MALEDLLSAVEHEEVDTSELRNNDAKTSKLSEFPPNMGVHLGQVLHEGSYCRVFEGKWMDTKVAVKVLKSVSNSSSPPAVQPDDLALASLSHPNIAQMFGRSTCQLSFDVWIVQEWCDRGSLSQHCNISRCHESFIPEVLSIALDVASAGFYIHSRGITHGSLTADSVLLKTDVADPKGYVCKIGDLCGTKPMQERLARPLSECRHVSVTCLPPECIQVGNSDARLSQCADVYAMGMIFWQVLTGTTPFDGLTPDQIAAEVQRGSFLSFDGIPGDLRNIVGLCLAGDPQDRPACHQLVRTFMNRVRINAISSQRTQRLEKCLGQLVTMVVQDQDEASMVPAST
jgi:serine/threonine protein kinase